MAETTLIIHGWSDCADSFIEVKKALIKQGIGNVETILYADYQSREDNLTFNDIIDGLNDQFIDKNIIDKKGKKLNDLNVIVHSTGALVIRHWIWRYYYRDGNRINDCPVKRLIMLAPANFGSPLAHRGKSFLGALFKGRWKIGDFLEVGRKILDGLELASPYQWELAHGDLFMASPYYNSNQIQVTILVGIDDYSGLRGWVNKPGTDGTVVIAGTSLDSTKLRLDFSKTGEVGTDYVPHNWRVTNPPDDFAFGVLQGLDHGSIVERAGDTQSEVHDVLLKALRTKTPVDFKTIQQHLENVTGDTYRVREKPVFQQFILHAIDDQDAPIYDFTIEFMLVKATKTKDTIVPKTRLSELELDYGQRVHEALMEEIHTNDTDSSYRRFLVNISKIKGIMEEAKQAIKENVALSMRVYVPEIDKGIRYDTTTLQNIVLFDPSNPKPELPSFFYPNTTTLIELKVDRMTSYVSVHP